MSKVLEKFDWIPEMTFTIEMFITHDFKFESNIS